MSSSIKELSSRLQDCMLKEQFLLSARLRSLSKSPTASKQLAALATKIENSIALVEKRKTSIPVISYDESLPVAEKREEIKKLIRENQVIVLAGETGSGKTTQIPKICLELGLGLKGFIGHTQPRRIAARSVANRIASELKTELGQCVGYKVRFSDKLNEFTHIKLMTDGILLAEIQQDRYLLNYEVIIIDEAHERSLTR